MLGRLRELGRLGPMALATAVLPMAGSSALAAVGYPLGNWMHANPAIGALVFVLGVVIVSGFAFLPPNLIGILSGWAFGFVFGLAILIVAIVGAALTGYFVSRRLAGGRLTQLTDRNVRANAIRQALTQEGFVRTTAIVTLMRMSVIMPFAFTNFFLAAAGVPVSTYVLGTFLGMLPRSAAMVLIGAGLSVLTFDGFNDRWFLLAGIPATLILIIAIGIFSRRALDRLTLDRPLSDVQPEMR